MKSFLIKPLLFGYTPIDLLNILFIQWLFVRLQAVGRIEDNEIILEQIQLIGPILPMTGWFSNYITFGLDIKLLISMNVE